MDNPVQIFTDEEFGEVRVRGDLDNPLFCLGDLCRILGLRVDKVVERLKKDASSKEPLSKGEPLFDGVLSKYPVQTAGGVQLMYFVNEDGFYDVLFDSRKPIAKRLRKWVTAVVLPSLRKYGTYSLTGETAPAAVAKPAKVKNPNRVAGQKTPAGIYAAKVGDKVKIGHSHDAEKRLPHIKGLTEKTYYQTALFPRKIARLLEWACHTIFAPYALGNELFDIEYDEACRIIKTLEKLIVGLSKVDNFERDDKSLVVATKNFVEYVNLIADKIN